MRIKYIATYDLKEYDYENRVYFPSATNKVDYICDVLNRIGISVDIISVSSTKNKVGLYKSRKVNLCGENMLIVSSAFGILWNKLVFLQKIYSWIWLFCYLIKNTKQGEVVLVYHGMNKIIPLLLVKKIKNLSYIIEVEEVFAELTNLPNWKSNFEMKMLNSADKFIFASEYLNRKVNKSNKPFSVVNGNYKIGPKMSDGFKDDKIHIVYAGIINSTKGAFTSVELARYLPNNYHIHILGYGDKPDLDSLIKYIDQLEDIHAVVSYEGLLSGEDYIKFIQNCHIGLCPQITDSKYNNASFPSKISSYLSNGLRVIASKTKAIEDSVLGQLIIFSSDDSPEEISKTVLSINLEDSYDSRKLISQLDKDFEFNFRLLFS